MNDPTLDIIEAMADDIAACIQSGFEKAFTDALSDADRCGLTGDDRLRSVAMTCFFAGMPMYSQIRDGLVSAAEKIAPG